MDIGDSDVETASDSYFNGEFYEDLTSAGFAVSAVLRSNGPDIAAWTALRNTWPSMWPTDHVFVVAQKVNDQEIGARQVARPVESDADVIAESQGPTRVDSASRFLIDRNEIGADYGVPEDVIDDVATELFDELERRGISPEDVFFSGYNGQDEDPDSTKLLAQEQLSFEEDTQPVYFLSSDSAFSESEADGVNPIHFAGTGSKAVIAAYDKQLLANIVQDPYILKQRGATGLQVNMTLANLNAAKVLEFHPRYYHI